MENLREQRAAEIDLQDLIIELLRRLWIILLAAILGALIGFFYTKMTKVPTYQSTTKIYVVNKQENASVSSGDLQFSEQILQDYAELIKSRTVLESVIVDNDLNMTYGQLAGCVSVYIPEGTHIITIGVVNTDPYFASELANAVRDAAALHIKNVMNVQAINTVDEANIPTSPIGPNIRKNTMMGGLAGAAAAIAVLVLIYMLNDTVKTPEDVEHYLGLSVLGSVPLEEHEKKSRRHIRRHHSKTKSKGDRNSENS